MLRQCRDIELAHAGALHSGFFVRMHRCFRLKVRRGGAIGGLDEVGSIVIDLIREGRRLLTNSYQVSYQDLAEFFEFRSSHVFALSTSATPDKGNCQSRY